MGERRIGPRGHKVQRTQAERGRVPTRPCSRSTVQAVRYLVGSTGGTARVSIYIAAPSHRQSEPVGAQSPPLCLPQHLMVHSWLSVAAMSWASSWLGVACTRNWPHSLRGTGREDTCKQGCATHTMAHPCGCGPLNRWPTAALAGCCPSAHVYMTRAVMNISRK